MSDLNLTPLDALHRELGGRMVPFAGYAMPVQYPAGILTEHLHCRAQAALFDVSHMGQATLHGPGAARALEALAPADLLGLKPGRQKYALLMTASGTILDDFMVANIGAAGRARSVIRVDHDVIRQLQIKVAQRVKLLFGQGLSVFLAQQIRPPR